MAWVFSCLECGKFFMFSGPGAKSEAYEEAEFHKKNKGHKKTTVFRLSDNPYESAKRVRNVNKERFYKAYPGFFMKMGRTQNLMNKKNLIKGKISATVYQLFDKAVTDLRNNRSPNPIIFPIILNSLGDKAKKKKGLRTVDDIKELSNEQLEYLTRKVRNKKKLGVEKRKNVLKANTKSMDDDLEDFTNKIKSLDSGAAVDLLNNLKKKRKTTEKLISASHKDWVDHAREYGMMTPQMHEKIISKLG